MNAYGRNSPPHNIDNQGVKNILSPKITSTPLSPLGKTRMLGPLITPRKFIGPRRYALSSNGNMSLKTALKDPPGPLLTSTNYNVNVSTYIDTKSPGYTGRLVQYSEESPRNKQLTHQEKYGSPGLFPIVHLFKKDPPVISPKPKKVTVHVGTPDLRSQFSQEHNRLILEGIVKNNSSKNTNQIHDNSTRSVLDALKEISRKRLHANEEFEFIDENNKKLRTDYSNDDGDSSKRNRLDSPISDTSLSPTSRQQTKRLCTIDAVLASKTSSMYASNYETGLKRKTSEDMKTKMSPINKKMFSTVETQTSDIASAKQDIRTNEKEELGKEIIKSDPSTEAQLQEDNVEPVQQKQVLKIFDDKPLEIIRKNRLGALLSALTGQEIPPIPMEDRRKALDQDWLPQKSDKLVSILSPSNKPKTSNQKQVKFNLPYSGDESCTSDLGTVSANEMPSTKHENSSSKAGQSSDTVLKSNKEEKNSNENKKVGEDVSSSTEAVPIPIQTPLGGFKFDLDKSNNANVKNDSPQFTFGKPVSLTNSVKTTEPEKCDSLPTLKSNDGKTNSLGLSTSFLPSKTTTCILNSNESLKLKNQTPSYNDLPSSKVTMFQQVGNSISAGITKSSVNFNTETSKIQPSDVTTSNPVGSPQNTNQIMSIKPIVDSINSPSNNNSKNEYSLSNYSTASSNLPSSFTFNTSKNSQSVSSVDNTMTSTKSLGISSFNNSLCKNSSSGTSSATSTVTTFSPNFGTNTSTSESLNRNEEMKTSTSTIPVFSSKITDTNSMFGTVSNTVTSSAPNIFDSIKVTSPSVTTSNQMFPNTTSSFPPNMAKPNSFGADSKLFTFGKNDTVATASTTASSSVLMGNAGVSSIPSTNFGSIATFPTTSGAVSVENNLEQSKLSTFTKGPFGSSGSSGFGSTNSPSFGTTNSANLQPVKTVSTFGTPSTIPPTTFSSSNTQTFASTNSNITNVVPNTTRTFSCPSTTAPFGTSTFAASTTSSLFGTSNTTTVSVFGTKSTPSFSSANTFGSPTLGIKSTPFGVTTTTASITLGVNNASASFGSSLSSNSFGQFGSNNPPFGSTSTTSSFATTTQTFGNSANSSFGASNTLNKPFGGNNFANNNNTSGTNTFGSKFGATSTKSEPSSFSIQGNMFNASNFGITSNGNASGNNVSKSEVFSFGSTNAPATTSSGVFTFGSTEPSKTFNFNNGTSTAGNSSGSSAFSSASTFGQTNNSTPLFGQNNISTPSFGASSHSFGQNNTRSPSFGQNNTLAAPFGQSNNSTTLFGQNSTSTVTFGQNNTPTPSFGLNNTPTPSFAQSNTIGSSFGQNNTPAPAFGQNNTSTPAFGQNNTPTPAFGQNNTTTPAFGQNNTTTPAFGQNNTPTPVFGQNSTPAPAFGQNSTSTPAFGQSSTSTPTFGQNSTPAPAFGQNSTATPTFGQNSTPTPTFGQNSTPNLSFGQSNMPSPAFGQNTTLTPSFGQNNTPNMFSIGSGPAGSQNRGRPLVRAKRRT